MILLILIWFGFVEYMLVKTDDIKYYMSSYPIYIYMNFSKAYVCPWFPSIILWTLNDKNKHTHIKVGLGVSLS